MKESDDLMHSHHPAGVKLLVSLIRDTESCAVTSQSAEQLTEVNDCFTEARLITAQAINDNAPVNRLSNEILLQIFQYVPRPTQSRYIVHWQPTVFHLHDLVQLTAVCRYWRSLLINSPYIWRTINTAQNSEVLIRRSAGCPLRLILDVNGHGDFVHWFDCLLKNQYALIQDVYLCAPHMNGLDWKAIRDCAHMNGTLRTLSLRRIEPPSFLSEGESHLQRLSLIDFHNLPINNFPYLTHLLLERQTPDACRNVMTMLQNSPNLKFLALQRCLPWSAAGYGNIKLSLPNLQRMYIVTTGLESAREFLSRIHVVSVDAAISIRSYTTKRRELIEMLPQTSLIPPITHLLLTTATTLNCKGSSIIIKGWSNVSGISIGPVNPSSRGFTTAFNDLVPNSLPRMLYLEGDILRGPSYTRILQAIPKSITEVHVMANDFGIIVDALHDKTILPELHILSTFIEVSSGCHFLTSINKLLRKVFEAKAQRHTLRIIFGCDNVENAMACLEPGLALSNVNLTITESQLDKVIPASCQMICGGWCKW